MSEIEVFDRKAVLERELKEAIKERDEARARASRSYAEAEAKTDAFWRDRFDKMGAERDEWKAKAQREYALRLETVEAWKAADLRRDAAHAQTWRELAAARSERDLLAEQIRQLHLSPELLRQDNTLAKLAREYQVAHDAAKAPDGDVHGALRVKEAMLDLARKQAGR